MGLENAVAEELATSGAIQEAEGGEAAPRYTRKALDGWALKKCRGLRAGVVDGYTRRGKKVVKMKKLIDVVCDHAKKAGPYVFFGGGKGQERRVITVPVEVAWLLVD